MIPKKLQKQLASIGIEISHFGPFKEYWELVYTAPFPPTTGSDDVYSEKKSLHTTRYISKDEDAERVLLLRLQDDLNNYTEAVITVESALMTFTRGKK